MALRPRGAGERPAVVLDPRQISYGREPTPATPAIDAGLSLPEFADDWDGQPRPQGKAWDIGADEFKP